MARMTVTESVRIEDGEHMAKLIEVNTKSGKNSKTGNYYEFLEMKFKMLDCPPEVQFDTISGSCPNKLNIGNQTYKWLTALNGGAEFGKGEQIDPMDFIGKQCRVIVESQPGTKNKDIIYSKVVNCLPLKKGQQAPTQGGAQQSTAQGTAQSPAGNNKDNEFEPSGNAGNKNKKAEEDF